MSRRARLAKRRIAGMQDDLRAGRMTVDRAAVLLGTTLPEIQHAITVAEFGEDDALARQAGRDRDQARILRKSLQGFLQAAGSFRNPSSPITVNGWSTSGLEFSREVRTSQERNDAVKDAWDTPHVVEVTVHHCVKDPRRKRNR